MAMFRIRPDQSSAVRHVTPLQFLGAILAFLLFSVLIGVLVAGSLIPVIGAAGATVRAAPETFEEIPDSLTLVHPSEESRMLDADGKEIARFYSTRRIVVNADQMSQTVKDAIVAIEDHRFYSHPGIDTDGLARALVNNLGGSGTQGASTLTQQFVKNMLLERGIQEGDQDLIDQAQEQSLERKLREARYAMALESRMTKEEILAGYLNVSPFGPNIYGVEAAARAYFSKSAKKLTVAEAALLAGLVQSPVEYDPLQHPEAAQDRRDDVLASMYKYEYITAEEYEEALALNVEDMLKPENRKEGCMGAKNNLGYFCRYVEEAFLDDPAFGETRQERETLLNRGGLVIRTTVDRDLQKAAFSAVKNRVPIDDNGGGKDTVDTAIVSVVPQTGYIVAMAQNTRFGPGGDEDKRMTEVSYNVYENRGGGSGFQPGSTFKVFTLTEWFREGRWAYEIVGGNNRDYPAGAFSCGGEPFPTGPWHVGDLDGKNGPQTVMNTMMKSINQGIASMATKIDYCKIFDRATDLGIVDKNGDPLGPDNPSQLIGGDTAVSPLQMASAYSTYANDGTRCEPMAIVEVADRDGNVIKSYAPDCEKVLDSQVSAQVATVLKRVVADYDYVWVNHPIAAKSGTTEENSNTWVVGFAPQLATAAWAGFANESSRGVQDMYIDGVYYSAVYGGDFIGPMWSEYMQDATADMEWIDIPEAFIGNKPLPVATKKATTKSDDSSNSSKSSSDD